MRRMVSQFGSQQRRDGRAELRLPCRVRAPDFEMPATVVDLSYGGAGISVPSGLATFGANNVRQISIEGLGAFEVIFRWKTSDRMGVSFKSQDSAKARIKAYFDANGIEPEPD